jgi:hypothetical protein
MIRKNATASHATMRVLGRSFTMRPSYTGTACSAWSVLCFGRIKLRVKPQKQKKLLKNEAPRRSPAERLDEVACVSTLHARPPHPYVITWAVEVADPLRWRARRPLGASISATSFSKSPRTVFSLLTPQASNDRVRSASFPNLGPLVDSPPVAPVASSPSSLLLSCFDANYTRIPLHEKDAGIKLEALYSSFTSATPPVHHKLLGKNQVRSDDGRDVPEYWTSPCLVGQFRRVVPCTPTPCTLIPEKWRGSLLFFRSSRVLAAGLWFSRGIIRGHRA